MTQGKRASLGAIFLTAFLDTLGFGLVMPFLADEARHAFGASELAGTLLTSAYSFMQFVFVPIWGRLSDRVGRRPILLWSIAVSATSLTALGLILSFGHSILWLFLVRALSGAATANMGTANAYVADTTSKEDRAKGMGLLGMAFGAGVIVGPAIGGALGDFSINGRHGPLACFIAAALAVVNLAWALASLPESLPAEHRRARTSSERAAAQSRGLGRDHPFGAMVVSLKRPGVATMICITLLESLGFAAFDQTFRFFTDDVFGMSGKQTGYLFLLMGATVVATQAAFIRASARSTSDLALLRLGIVLHVLGFAGIASSSWGGAWVLYASLVVLSAGAGVLGPNLLSLLSKRTPPTEQGATLGTEKAAQSLARMIGPALGGLLYEALSPAAPCWASATLMVLAGICGLWVSAEATEMQAATAGGGSGVASP